MATSEHPASTPLADAAAQMHELFTTMIAKGFTEAQACRILGVMLAEGSGPGETGNRG